MTKGCIPLHAEASRPCKRSVTDRITVKSLHSSVWEPFTARGPLLMIETVGKARQGVGVGLIL